MAITPKYSWPLPDLGDAPNIPFDVNALAVAIETTVDLATPYGVVTGNRGTDSGTVTGPSLLSTINLPSSPAGAVWRVTFADRLVFIANPGAVTCAPNPTTNCTMIGAGLGNQQTVRVVGDTFTLLSGGLVQVTATGTAVVRSFLSVDAGAQWMVQAASSFEAVRIK